MGRRPKRSASGPYTSVAMAVANRDTLKVNWAVDASTEKSRAMAGSAGRKICMANGPVAVTAARVTTNAKGARSCSIWDADIGAE